MEYVFKLTEFNVYNKNECDFDEDNITKSKIDKNKFYIQMFGLNAEGKTASIIVEDYKPFFFIKVGNNWGQTKKTAFFEHLKHKVGKYYEKSITDCRLIEREKLYGFDYGKKHRFIEIKFENINIFNKVKNFWYKDTTNSEGEKEKRLITNGYKFIYNEEILYVELYEANILPLLRLFHIREISPSGWIALPATNTTVVVEKTTYCDYEYYINYKHIIPLNNKEDGVPYKSLSVDIEASSSHGDFPVPVKSYKKLANNIVDYFEKLSDVDNKQKCKSILKQILYAAFGFTEMNNINIVYPKTNIKYEDELNIRIENWFKTKIKDNDINNNENYIELFFENANKMFNEDKDKEEPVNIEEEHSDDDSDTEEIVIEEDKKWNISNILKNQEYYNNKDSTIVDIMCDKTFKREGKINELTRTLRNHFPPLEGDKVTFIGSTLMIYGEKEPYFNHCIVLNTCDNLTIQNAVIETYETEKEVILAWTRFMQRENPDIILGYNTFNFDYEFMFRRAQENDCVEEFLKLSRNKNEICSAVDYTYSGKIDIDRSTTILASGTYDLSIIKMNGRLQVDMLNWFRRTETYTSYKLDDVSSHLIGDEIKEIQHFILDDKEVTRVITNNMTGLYEESYIHFKEISHSCNYYKGKQKFKVIRVCKKEKWFEIQGNEHPSSSKITWGLSKDDITPKDIFRMSNEGSASRAIVAKYCIQDCNLVHYLFNKVDVLTGLIEMSKLCSVPMSFLIYRGQGIKLTSYVAKKCREKGVLMPVLDKCTNNKGFEGAICLRPKCGLYLEESVDVGDFMSLYPSSMLSENLCPSSKLCSKEYDLSGNLIEEIGEKDLNNNLIYDNINGVEYVDKRFDTYSWIKKHPKAKAEKVVSGHKICRFAQPYQKDGVEVKAIMPSILEELLKARKDTKKLMKETKDSFMKNILDKRQNAYKVTANSLYGQLGAKSSTFYEPDVAASTTATGRLLLTFAKRVIEECYADAVVETTYGLVHTKSEYVYGDTDSVFFKFELIDVETGEIIKGDKELELSIEIAKEACDNVTKVLKKPHNFEYEKTFKPLCLPAKKRYSGIKYSDEHPEGERCEMGNVLKRQDCAPCVKDVYGGAIDILMVERNITNSINFVHSYLQNLVNGNISIDKLIITKSLRSFYKKPHTIPQHVLAERIGERDPGNKPKPGDKIPYVFIVTNTPKNGKKLLQGDRIESPSFIKDNNIQIDYSYYISNQIMKPLLQLYGLVLNNIWLSQRPPRRAKITQFANTIENVRKTEQDEKKSETKINKLKDKEVQELIFSKYLRDTNNIKNGNQNISSFFKSK
jgi:DNA polymerase elongation subunit (family B)